MAVNSQQSVYYVPQSNIVNGVSYSSPVSINRINYNVNNVASSISSNGNTTQQPITSNPFQANSSISIQNNSSFNQVANTSQVMNVVQVTQLPTSQTTNSSTAQTVYAQINQQSPIQINQHVPVNNSKVLQHNSISNSQINPVNCVNNQNKQPILIANQSSTPIVQVAIAPNQQTSQTVILQPSNYKIIAVSNPTLQSLSSNPVNPTIAPAVTLNNTETLNSPIKQVFSTNTEPVEPVKVVNNLKVSDSVKSNIDASIDDMMKQFKSNSNLSDSSDNTSDYEISETFKQPTKTKTPKKVPKKKSQLQKDSDTNDTDNMTINKLLNNGEDSLTNDNDIETKKTPRAKKTPSANKRKSSQNLSKFMKKTQKKKRKRTSSGEDDGPEDDSDDYEVPVSKTKSKAKSKKEETPSELVKVDNNDIANDEAAAQLLQASEGRRSVRSKKTKYLDEDPKLKDEDLLRPLTEAELAAEAAAEAAAASSMNSNILLTSQDEMIVDKILGMRLFKRKTMRKKEKVIESKSEGKVLDTKSEDKQIESIKESDENEKEIKENNESKVEPTEIVESIIKDDENVTDTLTGNLVKPEEVKFDNLNGEQENPTIKEQAESDPSNLKPIENIDEKPLKIEQDLSVKQDNQEENKPEDINSQKAKSNDNKPEEVLSEYEEDGGEIEVEEYFVKFKNFSYLHCDWKSRDELFSTDKRIDQKIKRFKLKKSQQPQFDWDENGGSLYNNEDDELFNPDYTEVDRVLDVFDIEDPSNKEIKTRYFLIKWKALPYDESTWELEQDIKEDTKKIQFFYKYHIQNPDLHQKHVARPKPDKWVQLKESRVYKNGNQLREYQLEGISWLTFCWVNGRNCILADEMGLGKTVQSVTFLHEMHLHGVNGPYLVIVPLSTIGNWLREFETWTEFNAIVYHGSAISRQMLQDYEFYFKENGTLPNVSNSIAINPDSKKVVKFNALITTYEVLMSDIVLFSEIKWRSVIIDEAHRLKNKNCRLMESLRYMNVEHKVLLTGTPLQNNVEELFSLLHFLEPQQFSSSVEFMAEFGDLKTDTQVNKLQAILKPMMLRRLKEDVEKNLAAKEETIVEVELTNTQKKFYRAILEKNFEFLYKGTTSSNMPNLMNTMMELRKCCNHPYLINGAEEQIINEHIENNKLSKEQQSNDLVSLKAMVQASGKLVLVDKLLPKLKANGHRVLIFSQMIRVLDILEDYLIQMRFTYERLDGRIRGEARQEAIDRYSKPDSDRFAFLLCTRAGGLGINLTAADTVIIFDSDWNPQNDLQAQARVHRIGQKKAVKIYRLITRNTYEREMFDKASLKLGLDKAVLQSMRNESKFNQTSQQAAAQQSMQLSKKEIEDLLKKGAYGALMEDDKAADKFCEEDIDKILQQRATVIQIEGGEKGSTFSKASFQTSETNDISIDDPEFWQKWAKKAEIDIEEKLNPIDERIIFEPRRRKQTRRFGGLEDLEESDYSSSDSENNPSNENITTKCAKDGKNGKKSKRGKEVETHDENSGKWLRDECYKVEKNLLTFGWSQWSKILENCEFSKKNKSNIQSEQDVESLSRCIIAFALRNYQGDESLRQYIIDLIDPLKSKFAQLSQKLCLSGPAVQVISKQNNFKNRKNKAVIKEDIEEQVKLTLNDLMNQVCSDDKEQHLLNLNSLEWTQNSEELIADEGYRKHLTKHTNKMLLKLKNLSYIKSEIIGDENSALIDNHCNESQILIKHIDMPEILTDLPTEWWNRSCDQSLIIGVYKHGYEKFYNIRLDPQLCFLGICGPPDPKDLLAEQQQQDEDVEEEVESKKSKKNRSSKKKNIFPSVSELNNRLRRLIACHQKSKKQELIQMKREAERLERLKSKKAFTQEKAVIKQLEKQKWSRREEQNFYRAISVYGVDCIDSNKNLYNWTQFKELSQLDKKLDETLTDYYQSFYAMCMKSCNRAINQESENLPVEIISEEKAIKCIQRIEFLNKVRQIVLKHSEFTEWVSKRCLPCSDLPEWWINGKHDIELITAAAKYGIIRTEHYFLNDVDFTFKQSLYKFTQHIEYLMSKDNAKIDPVQYYIQNQAKIKQTFLANPKKSTNNTIKDILNEMITEIEHKSNEPTLFFNINIIPAALWPKDRILTQRIEDIIQMFENNGEWPKPIQPTLPLPPPPVCIQPTINVPTNEMEIQQATAALLEPGEISTNNDSKNSNNKRTRRSMMPEPTVPQCQDSSSAALAALFLAPGLDLNDRITVINIENGSRLTGNKAPKRGELPVWLITHPNYLPDESEIIKLTQAHNDEPKAKQPKLSQLESTPENNNRNNSNSENNFYPDIILFNKQSGKKISGARVPNWKSLCSFLDKNQHIFIDPSCNDTLKSKFGRNPIPDIIKSRLINQTSSKYTKQNNNNNTNNNKNNNNNNQNNKMQTTPESVSSRSSTPSMPTSKQIKQNPKQKNDNLQNANTPNNNHELNNPLAGLIAAGFGGLNPFLSMQSSPDIFKDLASQISNGGFDMNTLEALAVSLTNNSNKTKEENVKQNHKSQHDLTKKQQQQQQQQQLNSSKSNGNNISSKSSSSNSNQSKDSKMSTSNNQTKRNTTSKSTQQSKSNEASSMLQEQDKFMQDLMSMSQLATNPFLNAAGIPPLPFNFMMPSLTNTTTNNKNNNNNNSSGSRSPSPSNDNQSISPASSIASSLSHQPSVDFNLLTNLMNLQMMNGFPGAPLPFMPGLPGLSSMPNDILSALAASTQAGPSFGMAGLDPNILNALALLNNQATNGSTNEKISGQSKSPSTQKQHSSSIPKTSNGNGKSNGSFASVNKNIPVKNSSVNKNTHVNNNNNNRHPNQNVEQKSNSNPNKSRTSNTTIDSPKTTMQTRKSSSGNEIRNQGLDLSLKKRH